MASKVTVDPAVVGTVARDVWSALYMLRMEFDRERFGMPDYDPRSDHAYEVLTSEMKVLEDLF